MMMEAQRVTSTPRRVGEHRGRNRAAAEVNNPLPEGCLLGRHRICVGLSQEIVERCHFRYCICIFSYMWCLTWNGLLNFVSCFLFFRKKWF